MTTCLIELPDEVFTQVRQVAVAEQKTLSQLIAEWLIQRVTTLRPPAPLADPDILKLFGSLPDLKDRGAPSEEASRAWLELTNLPVPTVQLTAGPPYHDLDSLAGTWTEQDSHEFFANVAQLAQVDEELWR